MEKTKESFFIMKSKCNHVSGMEYQKFSRASPSGYEFIEIDLCRCSEIEMWREKHVVESDLKAGADTSLGEVKLD